MFGIDVPARLLVIPAATALISLGALAVTRSHHAPKPVVAKPVRPPPTPIAPAIAPAPVTLEIAPAPTAPAFDLVAALQAIGTRALPPAPVDGGAPPVAIHAAGECKHPSANQRAKLAKQIAAWADHTYADEVANAAAGLELDVGCSEPTGWIVNAHVDRKRKHEELGRLSRWWMLRVQGDTVTVLAQRTSSAVDDWMEWADEGTLGAVAQVDLDHDGVRDVLWLDTEHEGGATRSEYTVWATLSKTGATTQIVRVDGQFDVEEINGTDVVVGLGDRYDHMTYRCIGEDLQLATCAASARIRVQVERLEIATRYANMTATTIPDAELLAEELVKLGVRAAKRAPLVAAAPETRPDQRASRDVARFVAKVRPDDDLSVIVQSPHDEARTYFASIRSQLGDATCEATPPSEADTARINAWIAVQPFAVKGKRQPPVMPTIVPACGPYVWVGWEDWSESRNISEGVRHEALLVLGDELARVVGFDFPATGDPQMGPATAHASTFYRHGDTIVGEVVHFTDDHMELFAIANDRVVAKRKGAFALYTYDGHWTDTSDDLILQAPSTWWHATPTGLERIDPEPLLAHEAKRAAIELLGEFDPTQPATKTAYVHALKTLGASNMLVREVRDL